MGRGVVFQTPIQERPSEADARQLIERYSKLVGAYSKGQLDRDLINNVKLRNDVSFKIGMIRSNLREQDRERN
jgi:LPS O-antigen subunit length determinant protein (WzzB/FepE family)